MLEPDRALLPFARAALPAVAQPPAAWERMYSSGYIPESWLADPSRWFLFPPQRGRRKRAVQWIPLEMRREVRPGVWASSCPAYFRDAALFASDVRGVTTAEQLARECERRWDTWATATASQFGYPKRGPNGRTLLWVTRDARPGAPAFPTWLPGVRFVELLHWTLLNAKSGWPAAPRFLNPRHQYVHTAFKTYKQWNELVHSSTARTFRALVTSAQTVRGRFGATPFQYMQWAPAPLLDLPLDQVPNLLAPLIALLQTGYMLWSMSEDSLTLLCPRAPA